MSRAISEQPFFVGGQWVHVGASIGVAHSQEHSRDLACLLDAADAALYRAKSWSRTASRPADPVSKLALVWDH
ncbi:MAG: hypothetical protein DI630_35775, partial [Gordonia sp. (in: high G+C Gram-positive bacteria)]